MCVGACVCVCMHACVICVYKLICTLVVPIPGGCATVSQLEYDPNLYLTHTQYTSTWNFSDANQGFSPASHHPAPPTCDDANKSRYPPIRNLEYFTYAYFLPERSYSLSDMFAGIEKMLSSDRVNSQSKKVCSTTDQSRCVVVPHSAL